MESIFFSKMHGLGNDFVLIDNRNFELVLDPKNVSILSNRRKGIGCDQLLILSESSNGADVHMRIFNPDGSEAEACGNGARCVAAYVMNGLTREHMTIETIGGVLKAERQSDGQIKVDMGSIKLEWDSIPLAEPCDTLSVPVSVGPLSCPVCVNVGNPHAVFFVDDVEVIDLETLGPELENHPMFPARSNIEVVSVVGANKIRMRVWERSAGITLACGSGACAAAVGAYLRGFVERKVEVRLDGGILEIEWSENGNVFLIGPAAASFSGTFDASLLQN